MESVVELAALSQETPRVVSVASVETLQATIDGSEVLPDIEISRLLTEVDHLASSLKEFGYVPNEIRDDVLVNKQTALSEIAMPYAVTRTAHRVEQVYIPEAQKMERVFRWLGRTATSVAESGYDFHFSKQAAKRVDIEVAEAIHTQETLQPGRVQFFISPRMSDTDAPAYIAAAEHLHEEDSIRASYLLTDSHGNESYRVMESLLVRDIPLDAWVAMLEDDQNIFSKSIQLEDKGSALSVMEAFSELELPLEQVQEGPVTIVSSVLPYIHDQDIRDSVKSQLERFRQDQCLYEEKAKFFSQEWYESSLELAASLEQGMSTDAVTSFIDNVSQEWEDYIKQRVESHRRGTRYIMTRELAALVEKAKRNIIATKAGIVTDNVKVIDQVDTQTVQRIKQAAHEDVNSVMTSMSNLNEIDRSIASQDVKVGGGCAGGACGLKAADPNSIEDLAAARELGIKPSELSKLVSYDKAWCPGCKSIGKVYYNAETSDAFCGCGFKKVDSKIIEPKKKPKAQQKPSIFTLAA